MHKNRLVLFDSIFNKVKYCFSCCVFRVKDYLVFKVQPLERKIDNTPAFKMVHDLLSCAVNNMSYFISNYKFLVLYLKK